MLDYSQFDDSYMSYEERESKRNQYVLDQIAERISKLKEKNKVISNLQYETDLITMDIVNCVRNDLATSRNNIFSGLVSDVMYFAWRFNCQKDEKYWQDKESYDKAKTAFEYITRTVSQRFLKDISNYTFKAIIMYNNNFGYDFQYEIDDITIEIYIPNFNATNSTNYTEMLYGYIIRWEESSHCWSYISSGFDIEKMNQDLIHFLKSKESN